MSVRELVVLGTASQVPTRHRNHNGYLLRFDGAGILFDPGEGTQRQMTIAGVSASDITAICITHFHGDHCLGLAGVAQRLSLDGVAHTVDLVYPASGAVFVDRLLHASLYDERARLTHHRLPHSQPLTHRDLHVHALPLDHRVESWGYRIEEPPRRNFVPDRLAAFGLHGPAVGALQRDGVTTVDDRVVRLEDVTVERPGQVVAFVMDTRVCTNAVELARGADLLVCESTFIAAEGDLAAAYGHLTARDAATIARQAGARRLVLTHFSQRHPDAQVYVDEASQVHPDVVAAVDGMRIPLPRPVRPAAERAS